MKTKFLLLLLISFSLVLFADDEVKGQIESLLQEQKIDSYSKSSASSQPKGLEKVQSWRHQGYPVTPYLLQNSGEVVVTAYVCEAKNRYWYRLQGTILKVDLWYGYYEYGYKAQANNSSYFLEHFSQKHCHECPVLQPKDLDSYTEYRTTDYGNVVSKYSHGVIYPGYQAYSYYCSQGQRYWVELVNTYNNSSTWYGPYPYYHKPPTTNKLQVIVELDKNNYQYNEAPLVRVWVQNNSAYQVQLKFSTGLRGDYSVDGYYQWSQNRMSIQMLGQEWIPAYGKKLLLEQHHPLNEYSLNYGTHRITGIIKTTNQGTLTSAEQSFTVSQPDSYNPPNWSESKLMDLAIKFMKKKKYEKARATLLKIIAQNSQNRIAYYNLACVESLTYNEDIALNYLERSLELGYRDFSHISKDPDLNNIRYLPRYYEIIRKYKSY